MFHQITHAGAVTALAASAVLTQIAAAELITRQDDCSDVHIFLAKGNNETEPGRQGKLVDAICAGLSSCDYEDIMFDNRYETVFCRSLEEGAINGRAQLTDYAGRCPESKLVVSGYSQGAHVVGDILGGGNGVFFQDCEQSPNEPLDPETSPGNQIVAALLFGDTRHTADQSYNVESGAEGNGLFPRTDQLLSDLNRYSAVLRSYCVSTDPICAEDMGPVVAETHLNYFEIYPQAAAAWVQEMVSNAANFTLRATSSSSSSSSSTSSSASSTSSTSSTSSAQSTADATTSEASATATDAAVSAAATDDSESGAGALRLQFAPAAAAVIAMIMI